MTVSLMALASHADTGSLTVVNNCAKQVYYDVSVFNDGSGWDSETREISPRGLHVPYDTTVSIKLSHDPVEIEGSISQFELNLDKDAGRIWYYISSAQVFGAGLPPFIESGMQLTAVGDENAQYPTCMPVNCPKGKRICNGPYNQSEDAMRLTCPHSTNLQLLICPQSNLPSPSGSREEIDRRAKSSDYNMAEKLFRERNTTGGNNTNFIVGGLTWQCCSSTNKTNIPKLPVLGMLAGLACYFITMLW